MKRKMTVKQLQNLKQFQNFDEESINEYINKPNLDFNTEKRSSELLKLIEKDYDLSNMNANDSVLLDDWIHISLQIQDLRNLIEKKMQEDNADWFEIKAMNEFLDKLRATSIKIQETLNITRKLRQGEGETTVVDFLEDLKKKSKFLLKDRLSYIYCPKCKLLNANVWFLDPESGNSVTITCSRKECGHKFSVTGSELVKNKNKNLKDGEVLPT